jgi:branched-chain amino acid transport system permease protein
MSRQDFTVTRATRASMVGTLLVAIVAAVLAAAPFWAGRDVLRLLIDLFMYLVLASLWNLLAGYAGLVSIGQQAFVGLGGYCLFALAALGGFSPLLGIPAAGLLGAVVAVPVAGVLFRLRGAYFAIGSWVMAEVFRLVASQISVLGGGSGTSLPVAVVTGIAHSRQGREFLVYWVALALALAVLGAIVVLLRSRWGLALTALRDNEMAARSFGIDVGRTKLLVFILAGGCTAMAGALLFLQRLRISPDAAFSVNDWTVFVIFITVIGGIGRFEGPFLGTALFFALRETLADLGSAYLMILGLIAILVMLKAPRGVWGFIAERTDLQILPLHRRVRRAGERAMPAEARKSLL